jgi:DNA-binding transcriptional ArsR family regulator
VARRRSKGKEFFPLDMQLNGCILEHMSMDAVFKALADPSRRRLLDSLHARNRQTLGELSELLAMTRQAVSKHLAILEEANLVVTSWEGREKFHFINPVPINEITERWIGKFERNRLRALSELKKNLEGKTDG